MLNPAKDPHLAKSQCSRIDRLCQFKESAKH